MNDSNKWILVVVDAGGTKSDWWVMLSDASAPFIVTTEGINVATGKSPQIKKTIQAFKKILSEYASGLLQSYDTFIYFYGAGCNTSSATEIIYSSFSSVFSTSDLTVNISSDLEGAARALFGNEEGVACILGTGSATGLYADGKVNESIPSLGFILGDEGSGSDMGRVLINKYFKRELSDSVKLLVESECDMRLEEIIRRTYKEPDAARFLASYVVFIKKNEHIPEISSIIHDCLKLFFKVNVLKYKMSAGTKIRFAGGLACVFENQLKIISEEFGYVADKFLSRPIESLGNYHFQKFLL